ncbi:hypothetical protein [Pseudomonas sp. AB12(2023)]|uniref:hypothetical protein n=2 Tax=Pseudomonas TaxID=286 RepID=UPI002B22957E|nr:hypothetical protein [Pseudomonas sp. AB12(2023)]
MLTTDKGLTPKQKAAAHARKYAREIQANAPKLILPAPAMSPLNPLLPDTADDEKNQLPQPHGVSLAVNIPIFERPGSDADGTPYYVQLLWSGVPVGPRYSGSLPILDAAFPIELELPASQTVNAGRYSLTYGFNVGGNPNYSDELSINIDNLAPNSGNAGNVVIVPAEVDRDGITKEYLDANGFVAVTIPEYGDAKIDDVIRVYYGVSQVTARLFAEFTRPDLNNVVTVELTTADIGTVEGEHGIYYTLADRVGNVGPASGFKHLNVRLNPAPANLRPPTVPLADDGLIDLADAYQGVAVVLEDEYDNFQAGQDQFAVTWDGLAQPPVTIPGFPVFVNIPFSAVKNGNDGPKTVHVSYAILRGTDRFPETVGADPQVDLRKPGPDNPDPDPGTENPALALVDVQGAVTTVPNKLELVDAGQDATAEVIIYEKYKAGDVVQLYWKGVAVPAPGGEYRVIGTEADDFLVPFTIPWAAIDTGGNDPELPVHYTIAHPSVNDNVDTSRPRLVDVLIKTASIPNPLFQNLDTDFTDWFNCSSLRNVAPFGVVAVIAVPGGEPQLADQELVFTYQGWRDAAGSTLIPSTTATIRFTPTTNEAANGFLVYVPYEPAMLASSPNWGSIEYTATIDGRPVTSQRHIVKTFFEIGGGDTCRIPLP